MGQLDAWGHANLLGHTEVGLLVIELEGVMHLVVLGLLRSFIQLSF